MLIRYIIVAIVLASLSPAAHAQDCRIVALKQGVDMSRHPFAAGLTLDNAGVAMTNEYGDPNGVYYIANEIMYPMADFYSPNCRTETDDQGFEYFAPDAPDIKAIRRVANIIDKYASSDDQAVDIATVAYMQPHSRCARDVRGIQTDSAFLSHVTDASELGAEEAATYDNVVAHLNNTLAIIPGDCQY